MDKKVVFFVLCGIGLGVGIGIASQKGKINKLRTENGDLTKEYVHLFASAISNDPNHVWMITNEQKAILKKAGYEF